MECINKKLCRWVSNKQISNPPPYRRTTAHNRMRGTTITGPNSSSSSKLIRRSAEYLLSSRQISIRVKEPSSNNSRPRCKTSFRETLVVVLSPTNLEMFAMTRHFTLEACLKSPSTTLTWCSSLLVRDTRLCLPLLQVTPSLPIESPCSMALSASPTRLKWIAATKRWTTRNSRERPSLFQCRLRALKTMTRWRMCLCATWQKNSLKTNCTSCSKPLDPFNQLNYRLSQTEAARVSATSNLNALSTQQQPLRVLMEPVSVASRLSLMCTKRNKIAILTKTEQPALQTFLWNTWTRAPQTPSWNRCSSHLARLTQSRFRLAVTVKLQTRAMSTSRRVKTHRTPFNRWTKRPPSTGPCLWSPSTSADNKTCRARATRTRWSLWRW